MQVHAPRVKYFVLKLRSSAISTADGVRTQQTINNEPSFAILFLCVGYYWCEHRKLNRRSDRGLVCVRVCNVCWFSLAVQLGFLLTSPLTYTPLDGGNSTPCSAFSTVAY